MLDERGDVRADEHLAVADAEHQRRGASGGDDGVGLVGVGEHQGEVALQPAQHGQHGRREIAGVLAALVLPGDEVDRDLGVGVAGELDACGLQLGAQRREILDDPVVDDRDLSRRVAVRVGVAVGGTAVGRPAGVTEARPAAEGGRIRLAERRFQIGQSTRAAADRQAAGAIQQRDAGRIVSAVFHPTKGIDDDATGRALPDITDDSAHSNLG